jgi:hypothetical protein
MPLTKLQFKPGINREGTNYSNEGGWYDGDKIRFRSGYVERIGGWNKVTTETYEGTVRQLHDFSTLSSESILFMGSEKKALLEESGTIYDITPNRRDVVLAADPLETTGGAGSGIITVTDVDHGASVGDFVVFKGATAFDGLTTGDLNKEHVVVTVINDDEYTVDTGGSATAGSTTGGGSALDAEYQIAIGLNSTVLGPGWGAGTWGRFTWSSAAGSLAGQTLRLWFADNFGEDLIVNIADGNLYYWDATNGKTNRAVELGTLTGASDVPTVARKVLVSEIDRHVLCFGANTIGTATQDPLLIRWSSQESVTDWTPKAENTAGDLRLSQGSEIVTAVRTSRQILVFTEHSLHSVQYIGPPYTFGTALLGDNIRIAGPNTAISVNDTVYWMGQEGFFMYDGRIRPIPCSVRQYVFDDLNRNQSFKFHAGSLTSANEIWWFYATADSNEVDRYVVYNYLENTWYYGSLARSAWNDRSSGARSYPQAAATDNFLYNHEFGLDDGSNSPATAINAYVESADFDIGDGDNFMFVRRVLPDLNFGQSTAANPEAEFTMSSRNYSGNVQGNTKTLTLSSNPIETTGGAGSGVITVTTPSNHGAAVGDFVEITGAATVDGLTTDNLNQRLKVASVPTLTTFTVNTGGSATTGSVTGGGSSVKVEFIKSGDAIRSSVVSGQDNYTNQLHMRLRGRHMALKVESNQIGCKWRLGAPRLDMRPDGRR